MTKFFSATTNGQTFLRSSASRSYSHMVAVRPSYDRALASASELSATDASNYRFHLDAVNGTSRFTFDADELARSAERLVGCHCARDYQEKVRDARVASVEAQKAAGYFDRFQDAGWAGRADLAQKNASSHAGRYAEVRILEAQEIDSPTYRALNKAAKGAQA